MTQLFPTRRLTSSFVDVSPAAKDVQTLVAYAPLETGEIIQHCSVSFVGDKKEEPLGTLIQSISFDESIDHPFLDGNMLIVRNGLIGIRTTYDMSHNRTHLTVLHLDTMPKKNIFTCKIQLKRLSPQELKGLQVKSVEDLFHDPELFVATRQQTVVAPVLSHCHVSKICSMQVEIPFVTMNQTKDFQISMDKYVSEQKELQTSSVIQQIWFSYGFTNIQTTSSMFDTLQLRDKSDTVQHTYSSPIQLQVLDKAIWDLFSTEEKAKVMQQKYLTITTGGIPLDVFRGCSLRFYLHPQFYKDYTNWVNEDRGKDKDIRNAVIIVRFGFLYM